MKRAILILCTTLLMGTLPAQIPNAGFENWTNGEPNSWTSNNMPGVATMVYQNNDAHGGAWAALLSVEDVFGNPFPGLINCGGAGGPGFPIPQAYNSLSFYYKSSLSGTDDLISSIVIYDAGGNPIGGGGSATSANATVYTLVSAPITYFGGTAASKATITLSIGLGGGGTIGSNVSIDDVAFSMGTGVAEINDAGISLCSPSPNPASGIALVPFTLDRTTVADIRIFDLNGRLVQNVLNQQLSAGNYKAEVNADALSSGVYTIVLRAADQVLQSKLVVR